MNLEIGYKIGNTPSKRKQKMNLEIGYKIGLSVEVKEFESLIYTQQTT